MLTNRKIRIESTPAAAKHTGRKMRIKSNWNNQRKSSGQNIKGHLLMRIRRDLIKSHKTRGISLYLDNQNNE